MNVTIDFKLKVSIFGYGIHSVSGIEISMNATQTRCSKIYAGDREGLGTRLHTHDNDRYMTLYPHTL